MTTVLTLNEYIYDFSVSTSFCNTRRSILSLSPPWERAWVRGKEEIV